MGMFIKDFRTDEKINDINSWKGLAVLCTKQTPTDIGIENRFGKNHIYIFFKRKNNRQKRIILSGDFDQTTNLKAIVRELPCLQGVHVSVDGISAGVVSPDNPKLVS